MGLAILIGLLFFLLVVLGLETLPAHSAAFSGLDAIGRSLIDMGASFGDVLQLPVTFPLYLIGHDHSLSVIQQQARHDGALWLAALAIWAALGLLAHAPAKLETDLSRS